MNFARYILAALFSLALIAGQALPAKATAIDAAVHCADCHCGMAKCCMAASSNDPQPEPAVPAQTNTRHDWQALSPILHLLPAVPAIELPEPHLAQPSARLETAVALYARDCSYLI